MLHNIMSIASADVLLMILYCTAASTLFSDSASYTIFIFFECQHVKDYNLESTCIQEGLSFHCRNTIKCHLLSEMLCLTYTTDICAVRFK